MGVEKIKNKNKNRLYIGIMIGLTIVTTSIILNFHPDKDTMTFTKGYFQFIDNTKNEMTVLISSTDEDESLDTRDLVIDDMALERFVQFYGGKKIEALEIYEKEEARYILESMGYNNTTKLKEYLESENKDGEKIYELLNSHLFEDQIMKLDNMLK